MKKQLICTVLSLFFASVISAQNNDIDKNLTMYSEVWDAIINNGEIEKINSENFDKNATIVMRPENIVGIENFKAYYQNFLTGFSEIEFTIIDAFGQEDKIVKHWNFKGKHTGDFFGIPPTGKEVKVQGVTLVKMKNAKILQEQDFMDNMEFYSQLGLISDPNNKAVINSLYEAFSIGDIPAALSTMDPEIVWNEAEGNSYASGNPYIGPEAVLNGVFAKIGADHEYFKLNDIELHEMSNNKVLATLRYNAKIKDNAATYDAQVAHLFTLKDGKIISFQQFVDTKKIDEAFKM
ncbi:hypothetical protein BC962_2200 [Gillisia mitskevichiae]|uniref:SnoaL-like domain-containing protein n=1 Tax=Gillisia mitskevichiae TaxID=270921 RepID=A0A495PTJ3_9FLAO|nr:nuclear transport factor 2 family protein [Gillisia mitskevichiae]RKS53933.1 hypothetical protein BC962_2200 [Gillisia mitskevichiae]